MDFTIWEEGLLNTATSGLGSEEIVGWDFVLSCGFVVSWLWEWVDGCVVVWIVLLSCSGRMLLLVSPGVLWSSPSTVALDVDVVGSSADTEETILTPVSSPGVSDEPVLLVVFNTIADDGDVVNNVHITSGITEDTSSVVLKGIWDGNTASDWSTLGNFLHHVLLAFDFTELGNTVDKVLIWDEASFARVAVAAMVH